MPPIDPPDVVRLEHGVLVLSPRGNLDSDEACRALMDAVRTELRNGGLSLVIDCSRVDRVDGLGLRALFMAVLLTGRCRARLALCHVAPKVRRVLALTHLDDRVPIADGRDEATVVASIPRLRKTASAAHSAAQPNPSAPPTPIVGPEHDQADPVAGRTIAHYRIGNRLEDGSLGSVYRAEDTRSARAVAVELLPIGFDTDIDIEDLRHRVARARAVHHANIGVVLDVEWDDGHLAVVRELLSGDMLPALRPADGGPWAERRVLALAIQLAGALEAAHAHGIVHAEIRPTKIFITTGGDAKLLDVGLSWIRQSFVLTKEVVAFAAPEQITGVATDTRTDIYSLGLVLYALLTGSKPFMGPSDSVGQVMSNVLTSELPPPRVVTPTVSAELSVVVGKAVRKLRADRYQSAADLLADLRRITI